jgi:DNA-binding IclR family transcriptional regulator
VPTETSQTLDRGLRVLDALAAASNGLTVTELAAAIGVNRTVVYRLVSTLEQHALVRRDPRGRLQVGLGVLRLASAVQPVLRDLALPVLRDLAEAVGCTAHLTVADGDEALALAVAEPTWTDFHVGYRVGSRHPLDRGAAGRAILLGREIAASSGSSRAAATAKRPATAAVPRPAAGTARNARVTPDRWSLTTGELQTGARGLAAPVLGVDGLEASVGIVTLGDIDADAIAPRVVRAAAEVAARLG